MAVALWWLSGQQTASVAKPCPVYPAVHLTKNAPVGKDITDPQEANILVTNNPELSRWEGNKRLLLSVAPTLLTLASPMAPLLLNNSHH